MQSVAYVDSLPLGGFNYENCLRNKAMLANAKSSDGLANNLKHAKTGTTICGIVFKVSPAISQLICPRFTGWSRPLR